MEDGKELKINYILADECCRAGLAITIKEMKQNLMKIAHNFYNQRNIYYSMIMKYEMELIRAGYNIGDIRLIFEEKKVSYNHPCSLDAITNGLDSITNIQDRYALMAALYFFRNHYKIYSKIQRYDRVIDALSETHNEVIEFYIRNRLEQKSRFTHKYPGINTRLLGWLGSIVPINHYYKEPTLNKYATIMKRRELIKNGIEPKSFRNPNGEEWRVYNTENEFPFFNWIRGSRYLDITSFYKYIPSKPKLERWNTFINANPNATTDEKRNHIIRNYRGAYPKTKMLYRYDPYFKMSYKESAIKISS